MADGRKEAGDRRGDPSAPKPDGRRLATPSDTSEPSYRTLIENAADAMIVHRDETIVFANPAGVALYAAERVGEVIGRPIWDFIAPRSREMSAKRVDAITSDATTLPPVLVDLIDLQGDEFVGEARDVRIPWEGGTAVLTTIRDLRPGEAAEAAVAEAEEYAAAIVDSIPIGMHFYHLEGDDRLVLTGANPAADAILGFYHTTLVGKEIREAFPSLAASGVPEIYTRIAREGGSWHDENVLYEDKRIASSFDVHAFQTGPGAMAAAFTDITERKRAEVALAAVSALQSAIFASMHDGFSILDPEGVHLSVNPAMCELTGFAEDELVGVGLPHPYWPPEEYGAIQTAFERSARGEATEFELVFMRKSGERFPALVTPSTVRDADGAVVSIFATIRDITARKNAEEELRASEQRYRSVVAVLRDGIILQAADGRLLSFNDAAARIFHIEPADVLGQTSVSRDWGTIRPDGTELPGEEHPSMITFRTGKPCTDVLVGVKGPDGVRWIEVNTEPMLRPGEEHPYAVVVSCTDVTERRRAAEELESYRNDLEQVVEQRTLELTQANKELEEASRAKDQFLASMSHELRTPLNSIIGFTGIMLQGLTGELTSEQRAQLEMVNRSGRQLLGLVGDVLDLARIERGRIELDTEDVDVERLLRTMAETVRPMAEDVGLSLDVEVDPGSMKVRTDRAKLEQILLNFLSNAIKYTEQGGITLHFGTADDGSAVFTVRDTGAGIALEDQASIFDEFRQLPAQRGAKHPGSGLGLAISRQLAEVLGGRIELESEIGNGSTFRLVLPPPGPSTHGDAPE